MVLGACDSKPCETKPFKLLCNVGCVILRVSSWFLMSSERATPPFAAITNALRERRLFHFGSVYPIQGPTPSPKAIRVIVIRLNNVVQT